MLRTILKRPHLREIAPASGRRNGVTANLPASIDPRPGRPTPRPRPPGALQNSIPRLQYNPAAVYETHSRSEEPIEANARSLFELTPTVPLAGIAHRA